MKTRALSALLLALCLLLGCASAEEQQPRMVMQDTTIGESYVRYPQLEGLVDEAIQQAVNDTIVTDGGVAGYLVTLSTLGGGPLGLQVSSETALMGDLLSVVIHARGKMSNGREGDENKAMVFDLTTGQRVTLADLLESPDEAALALESSLEATWAEEFSGYMENSAISPLPADNFAIDENGVTFYYPAEQVKLLSGYAGAAAFSYGELQDLAQLKLGDGDVLTRAGVKPRAAKTAEEIRALISTGSLPGVPAVIGDDLPQVLKAYRLSRTPDQYPGGRYFVLEAPQFRSVLLLSDALTPKGYEGSKVEGILSRRCDLLGLGMQNTRQQDWRALLGQPEATVAYSEAEAYDYGYPEGEMDYYTMGDYTLRLYVGTDGVLALVILSK